MTRSPAAIEIPDPSLVVLVGAAGAGKSTFAARHFARHEILSSDALREAIAGDPSDQAATGPAFAALHRSLTHRLRRGRLTVVDATNVMARARLALIRRASAAGVPAVGIVLDLPDAVVLRRNATRGGRVVPEATVRAQLGELRRSLEAGRLEAEGFASVIRVLDPADLDRIRVARVVSRAAGRDPCGGP